MAQRPCKELLLPRMRRILPVRQAPLTQQLLAPVEHQAPLILMARPPVRPKILPRLQISAKARHRTVPTKSTDVCAQLFPRVNASSMYVDPNR